jgi:hypothetical protein
MKRINRHYAPSGCRVVFVAEGATAADIARGKAAVTAKFDAADVHIYAAATAAFRQAKYHPSDDRASKEVAFTAEECAWGELWRNAPAVALAAAGCKPDNGGKPYDFRLDWPGCPKFSTDLAE